LVLFIISFCLFWMNIFQGMYAAKVYLKIDPHKSLAIFISFVAFGCLLSFVFIDLLVVNFSAKP
jgi:hypothetical protein